MYNLEEGEGLVRKTDYILARNGKKNLSFCVMEILSPEKEEKFIATPTQAIEYDAPKEEYTIRGSVELDCLNKLIEKMRGVEKSSEMFEKTESKKK